MIGVGKNPHIGLGAELESHFPYWWELAWETSDVHSSGQFGYDSRIWTYSTPVPPNKLPYSQSPSEPTSDSDSMEAASWCPKTSMVPFSCLLDMSNFLMHCECGSQGRLEVNSQPLRKEPEGVVGFVSKDEEWVLPPLQVIWLLWAPVSFVKIRIAMKVSFILVPVMVTVKSCDRRHQKFTFKMTNLSLSRV